MARRSASQAPATESSGSVETKIVRCAIYTRKSTEEGLQQEFNSLDAQREASEAFVASQKHEGWQVVTEQFDDGGYTGGNMDRPAVKRLLAAVEARSIDCIVVYKVDRLSRSLLDFARIIEVFDRNGVNFVAVTQQFNTTSSLGRLTLNILLSFAQFEREIISERTRDKMSAARRKGKWIGGHPVLGYDIDSKGGRIIINPAEAEQVRTLFGLYLTKGSTLPVLQETQRVGLVSKRWTTEDGKVWGGKPFTRGSLHATLTNVLYTGMVDHKGVLYTGEQDRIADQETWDRVHETLRRNGSDKGATTRNKLGALLRGAPLLRSMRYSDDAYLHDEEVETVSLLRLQTSFLVFLFVVNDKGYLFTEPRLSLSVSPINPSISICSKTSQSRALRGNIAIYAARWPPNGSP